MAGEDVMPGGVGGEAPGGAMPPAIAEARSDLPTPGWEWYYLSGGKMVGPMGDGEFRELVLRGRVRPETAVWSASLGAWRRARAVYELAETMRAGGEARAKAPPTVRGQVIVRTPGVSLPSHGAAPSVGLRLVAPVGRSPASIAAGYLGILSVLVVFAPFAVLIGVMALVELRKQPHLLGRGRAWFGVVMGSAVLVVAALMALGVLPSPW